MEEQVVPETPPAKPLVWPSFVTVMLSLLAVLASAVVVAIIVMGLSALRGEKGVSPVDLMLRPGAIVLAAAATQISLLLSVRFLPGLFKDVDVSGWYERVQWRPERFNPLHVLLAWLGTMAVGSLASVVLEPLRSKSDILTRFGEVARTADASTFALLLLFGAVAPGLAEEMMFRGLLQSRFIARWGPMAGIALSALLFGVYHADLRQGLGAMTMGVWIGWLAWREGTIVNVAFGHGLNNASAFLLSRFMTNPDELDGRPELIVGSVVVLLVCIGVMALRTRKVAT